MAPARVKEINHGGGPLTRPRRGSSRPGRRLFCRRKTHCARGTLNCLLWLQGRSIGCNLSGVYEGHHLSDNLRAGGIPPEDGEGRIKDLLERVLRGCTAGDEAGTNSTSTVGFLRRDDTVSLPICSSCTGGNRARTPPPTQTFHKTHKRLTSD